MKNSIDILTVNTYPQNIGSRAKRSRIGKLKTLRASSVSLIDRQGNERLNFEAVDKITPSVEGVLLDVMYFKAMTVRDGSGKWH